MPITHHMPAGPMNFATLFPAVDFSQVEEYYLQLISVEGSETVLTTPTYQRSCCCDDDTMRLFFVNYLGGIDAININRTVKEHETTSSSWKKPLAYPHAKWDGGKQRFNVTSNQIVTGENRCFQEEDQDFLKELMDAPNAWVQWTGTQSQSDDYIPVVIRDGRFDTKKNQGRYEYVLVVTFEMANENIVLRN
jgi:hypothetical protein